MITGGCFLRPSLLAKAGRMRPALWCEGISFGNRSVDSPKAPAISAFQVRSFRTVLYRVVNDAEDGLIADIEEWLERLAPFRQDYRHHRTGETNGDAHLKSLLVHHEVIVPVTNGSLDLGPWQQVYYAEFDGRRRKRVILKALGE